MSCHEIFYRRGVIAKRWIETMEGRYPTALANYWC
jgi:hypothetical protein